MNNRFKLEEYPQIAMSSTRFTSENSSFSSSTTTTKTANFSRTTERASFPARSHLIPMRSAFTNDPMAPYRSLREPSTSSSNSALEKKTSKSLFSIFGKGDKEKEDKLKRDKEEKLKKQKELEETLKKEKEEKLRKEKEEKMRKEQEEKLKKKNKKKKEKDKDLKNGNISNVITTFDAKGNPSRLTNNSYYTPAIRSINYINVQELENKLVVKVVKTGVIYPLPNDVKIPYYETTSKYRRGKVLLMNNIAFENTKYRSGAQVDHDNIIKLFRDMGFAIEDHKNKNKKDMEKIISNYCSNSSLKSADINVTIIMSHGNGVNNNTYIETIDNKSVEIEWIVNQFGNDNCKYLADRPKIFIFQCCRGERMDTLEMDATPFQTPRNKSDVLLAYATVPGFVSVRDAKLGTWYIQSICKIFMEHAHDTDIENLLKIVDENLASTKSYHRQTSSYENRGFKRCFLNPVK